MRVWLCVLLLWASPSWAAWTETPASVQLDAVYNQNPLSFSVFVTNGGTTAVSIVWDDNINWFKTITPSNATLSVPAGQTASFTMVVDVQKPWNCSPACPMAVGTYSSSFKLSGGGQVVTIPISLTIAPTGPPPVPGPAGPTTLTIVTVPDPVKLAWDANKEPDLAGYRLYARFPTGAYGAPLVSTTATAGSVTGLQAGTTYVFAVSAYDTSNNESAKSNEVTVTTPP